MYIYTEDLYLHFGRIDHLRAITRTICVSGIPTKNPKKFLKNFIYNIYIKLFYMIYIYINAMEMVSHKSMLKKIKST